MDTHRAAGTLSARMARVLYAWELGGGLGHLAHARAIAEPLVRAGHELTFVLRNPLPAPRLLAGLGRVLAAPVWPARPAARGPAPFPSYPGLLAALGYGDREALVALAGAWRDTVELARPDVVIADHAPTALVGARALGVPPVPVGSGFFVPPPVAPMPLYVEGPRVARADGEALERAVHASIAHALAALGGAPVASVGELFAGRTLLLAYPELDHYDARPSGADYWGVPPPVRGAPVVFPPGGPRVFAYLKPFPGLDALLAALADAGAATLVYAPGVAREVRDRHASARLVFLDAAADIHEVARACDVAVAHGGIGTLAYVLLEGKPLLLLPLQLEQLLLCRRVAAFGAAVSLEAHDAASFRDALARLLGGGTYRDAARAFAARHPFPTAEAFEARLLALVATPS